MTTTVKGVRADRTSRRVSPKVPCGLRVLCASPVSVRALCHIVRDFSRDRSTRSGPRARQASGTIHRREQLNLLHAYDPVDAGTFQHHNRLRVDVAVDHRGTLQFELIVGDDRSVNHAADHHFTGVQIAADGAVTTEHHLPSAKDGPFDPPVELDGAVRFNVANDAHASRDDRKRGLRNASANVALVGVLSEQCHESPLGQCAMELEALFLVAANPAFGGAEVAAGVVRVDALSICCT